MRKCRLNQLRHYRAISQEMTHSENEISPSGDFYFYYNKRETFIDNKFREALNKKVLEMFLFVFQFQYAGDSNSNCY